MLTENVYAERINIYIYTLIKNVNLKIDSYELIIILYYML